jgi:lipopolysaccharide/colanic/teichoic acid biosynthesis glycosyltransferase
MARRLVDVLLASLGLVVLAPVLLLAAVGIRLSNPGPILYHAQRVGRRRTRFTMYKLRTMRVNHAPQQSVITAQRDPRVFRFGNWLRRSKVDELPQLFNVLRGEMAIVGPRPEAPSIVDQHYTALEYETLEARPGLASPGSIYNFTHGETVLASGDPEKDYVERLLRLKLALDVVYVRRASALYDAAIIARTLWVILASLVGRRHFPDPPEMTEALRLLSEPRER